MIGIEIPKIITYTKLTAKRNGTVKLVLKIGINFKLDINKGGFRNIKNFINKEKMSEEISNKVKKIVADHLGIDEAKVTEESSFIDDLGADSLDTVELVMAFEEEFGSEISDSDAEKILTVGDAVKFIENKAN